MMRIATFTLVLLGLLALAGGHAPPVSAQDEATEEAGPAEDLRGDPLAEALAVLLILGGAGGIGFLFLRKSRARGDSSRQAIQEASRLPPEERALALRRIEGLADREDTFTQVFVYDQAARNLHTYRAAYELMVRGLQVRLYSEAPVSDFSMGKKMRRMDLTKAVKYTTESLAPYVEGISAIGDFAKHIPYQRRNRLALVVHTEDLEEAYRLLVDLGIQRVGTQSPPEASLDR